MKGQGPGHRLVLVGGLLVMVAASVHAQWAAPALLNDDQSETSIEIKVGALATARAGGVHCAYAPNSTNIRYRCIHANGSRGPLVTVRSGAFYNPFVAIDESPNGDINMAYEDWTGGPNNIRWSKSTDGGASFPYTQLLTTGGGAKTPQLAASGTQGGAVVMSYRQSSGSVLNYRYYDGASWTPDTFMNSWAQAEYSCMGMARSPLDGSIYRAFDPDTSTMYMRRWCLGGWSSEIPLVSGMEPVRQHMAINANGQIMLVWDSNSRVRAMLYTPGVGPGPIADLGSCGYRGSTDVCWIRGTDDFYMAVGSDVGGGRWNIDGYRYSGGTWQPYETVMSSQSSGLLCSVLLAGDVSGKVYCAWEHWISGTPQMWYTVRTPFVLSGATGWITGTVRDSQGAPLANAEISIPGTFSTLVRADGTYSLQSPAGIRLVKACRALYPEQTVSNVTVPLNGTTVLDFTLTPAAPAQIAALAVAAGNTVNTLTWTGPASSTFNHTHLRYSFSGCPTSLTDGTFLADVPGIPGVVSTFTHSGLTNGTTIYYSAFACFEDASTFFASGRASGSAAPYGPGDLDHDGDVDQADFGLLQACLSGPYVVQSLPACQDARFDSDDDVDADDVELWRTCFSGPGVLANPQCR